MVQLLGHTTQTFFYLLFCCPLFPRKVRFWRNVITS